MFESLILYQVVSVGEWIPESPLGAILSMQLIAPGGEEVWELEVLEDASWKLNKRMKEDPS